MSDMKDLLPYIHVFCGPRIDQTVYFLATDAGKGMQITKYASANADSAWAESVATIFKDVVDPRTLKMFQEGSAKIKDLLQQGWGSIWVAPDKVRVSTASSA